MLVTVTITSTHCKLIPFILAAGENLGASEQSRTTDLTEALVACQSMSLAVSPFDCDTDV